MVRRGGQKRWRSFSQPSGADGARRRQDWASSIESVSGAGIGQIPDVLEPPATPATQDAPQQVPHHANQLAGDIDDGSDDEDALPVSAPLMHLPAPGSSILPLTTQAGAGDEAPGTGTSQEFGVYEAPTASDSSTGGSSGNDSSDVGVHGTVELQKDAVSSLLLGEGAMPLPAAVSQLGGWAGVLDVLSSDVRSWAGDTLEVLQARHEVVEGMFTAFTHCILGSSSQDDVSQSRISADMETAALVQLLRGEGDGSDSDSDMPVPAFSTFAEAADDILSGQPPAAMAAHLSQLNTCGTQQGRRTAACVMAGVRWWVDALRSDIGRLSEIKSAAQEGRLQSSAVLRAILNLRSNGVTIFPTDYRLLGLHGSAMGTPVGVLTRAVALCASTQAEADPTSCQVGVVLDILHGGACFQPGRRMVILAGGFGAGKTHTARKVLPLLLCPWGSPPKQAFGGQGMKGVASVASGAACCIAATVRSGQQDIISGGVAGRIAHQHAVTCAAIAQACLSPDTVAPATVVVADEAQQLLLGDIWSGAAASAGSRRKAATAQERLPGATVLMEWLNSPPDNMLIILTMNVDSHSQEPLAATVKGSMLADDQWGSVQVDKMLQITSSLLARLRADTARVLDGPSLDGAEGALTRMLGCATVIMRGSTSSPEKVVASRVVSDISEISQALSEVLSSPQQVYALVQVASWGITPTPSSDELLRVATAIGSVGIFMSVPHLIATATEKTNRILKGSVCGASNARVMKGALDRACFTAQRSASTIAADIVRRVSQSVMRQHLRGAWRLGDEAVASMSAPVFAVSICAWAGGHELPAGIASTGWGFAQCAPFTMPTCSGGAVVVSNLDDGDLWQAAGAIATVGPGAEDVRASLLLGEGGYGLAGGETTGDADMHVPATVQARFAEAMARAEEKIHDGSLTPIPFFFSMDAAGPPSTATICAATRLVWLGDTMVLPVPCCSQARGVALPAIVNALRIPLPMHGHAEMQAAEKAQSCLLCEDIHDLKSRRGCATTHPMSIAMSSCLPVSQLTWTKVTAKVLAAARISKLGVVGQLVQPQLIAGVSGSLRDTMPDAERYTRLLMPQDPWGGSTLPLMTSGSLEEDRLMTLLLFVSPVYAELCRGMSALARRSRRSQRKSPGVMPSSRVAHTASTASPLSLLIAAIDSCVSTTFKTRGSHPQCVPGLSVRGVHMQYPLPVQPLTDHLGIEAALPVESWALEGDPWAEVYDGAQIISERLDGASRKSKGIALGLYGGISSMGTGTLAVEPLSLCLPSATCRALGIALVQQRRTYLQSSVQGLGGVPVDSVMLARGYSYLRAVGLERCTVSVFLNEMLQHFPTPIGAPPRLLQPAAPSEASAAGVAAHL